jgi:hypothetical protein
MTATFSPSQSLVGRSLLGSIHPLTVNLSLSARPFLLHCLQAHHEAFLVLSPSNISYNEDTLCDGLRLLGIIGDGIRYNKRRCQ